MGLQGFSNSDKSAIFPMTKKHVFSQPTGNADVAEGIRKTRAAQQLVLGLI
jgi:hypothetical protein